MIRSTNVNKYLPINYLIHSIPFDRSNIEK